MSRWEPDWRPDIDLMRLLEALASEVVATTAPEVRQVCAERRRSMSRSVREVRELIDAASDDAVESDIDVETGRIELRSPPQPGSRACYKRAS